MSRNRCNLKLKYREKLQVAIDVKGMEDGVDGRKMRESLKREHRMSSGCSFLDFASKSSGTVLQQACMCSLPNRLAGAGLARQLFVDLK